MILKKADGQTLDNLIENTRNSAEEILAPLRRETEIDGVRKTVLKAPDAKTMGLARRQLILKTAELNDRRNQILNVASAWFDNALFGNGFFHGDLHGGNLMTGTSGTTFIDFGNCSRFSPEEQTSMQLMLACVVSGDTDRVINNFKALMPKDAVNIFDQKFPAGSDARNRLEAVLKRGTSLDLMSRVQAFISIVQGEDVPRSRTSSRATSVLQTSWRTSTARWRISKSPQPPSTATCPRSATQKAVRARSRS